MRLANEEAALSGQLSADGRDTRGLAPERTDPDTTRGHRLGLKDPDRYSVVTWSNRKEPDSSD